MKFYETHYEDYYQAVEGGTFHPELSALYDAFPPTLATFENMILYGPQGSGKYAQLIHFLRRYSPSSLKYEKRMMLNTEKQNYSYKISDIHYEVDMALLGCNSKVLWHEVFTQIVDIVSMKTQDKYGIIVCKNFHTIHNELLAIFYSYLQQYPGTSKNTSALGTPIQIKFVLMTEHVSFIPNNILERCFILSVPRPVRSVVQKQHGRTKTKMNRDNMTRILEQLSMENITNLKELYAFSHMESVDQIPHDVFNVICDAIIQEMGHPETRNIMAFRDLLYDMLIYNLDVYECVWYIFAHFVDQGVFDNAVPVFNRLLASVYVFLKQYGNNYRAIFHLESVVFEIMNAVQEAQAQAQAQAPV